MKALPYTHNTYIFIFVLTFRQLFIFAKAGKTEAAIYERVRLCYGRVAVVVCLGFFAF